MKKKCSVWLSGASFLLCCTLSFALPSQAVTKRALLVGINNYKHLPYYSEKLQREVTNLKGAVNDVAIIKERLIKQFGFAEEDVKVLKDTEATKAGILKALDDWCIKGTKPGDIVFFYFSGHGTQLPDQNGENELHGALCTYEMLTRGTFKELKQGLIVDDELADAFKRLEGRTVAALIDSCHSGTLSRRLRGVSVAELELTPAYRVKFVSMEVIDDNTGGKDLSFDYARKQSAPIPGHVFLYSSLESQSSVEMTMPNGTSNGVFTLAVVDALRSAQHATYASLYQNASGFVANRCKGIQTPQIWPDAGSILTDRFLSPPPPSVVAQASATAPVEKPHKPPRAEPVAGRPAVQIQPPVSTLPAPQVPEPPPEAKDEKVIVRVDSIKGAPTAIAGKIEEALGKLNYVKLTKEDFFDRIIRGDMNKRVLRVRLVNRIGDTVPLPPAHNVDEVVKALIRQLENDYAVKQLVRIHNPHPSFGIRVWVTDEKRNDFMIGEKVEFNVVAEKDCYLLVLDKDNEGNITLLYPNKFRSDNFVRGGATLKIPDESMKFDLRFFEPAGEETVKVIATDKPLKLEEIGISDIKPYLTPQGFINLGTANAGVKRSIRPVARIQENLATGAFTWSDAMVVIRSHKKQ